MPTVQVNNIDLYYEVRGQGQPLLFIHGLGSSTRDWEYQLPYFVERYQVITCDLRGHGKSSKPPGRYTIPGFADDVGQLLKALNVGPTHLVGLSLGGAVALQTAIAFPRLVQSLVIVNSGPKIPMKTLKERLRIVANFVLRQLMVRLFGMRFLGELLGKKLLPEPKQDRLRQTFTKRWAENDKRAYLAAMGAFRGWSVTDHLSSVTCPVLLIVAEQDYTPVSFKQAYAAKMPQAELVIIPGARHLTPIEKPVEFNKVLANFLGKLEK